MAASRKTKGAINMDNEMYESLIQWVEMLQNDENEEVIDEMMQLITVYEA